MTDIQVPKLNSNDPGYLLTEWIADDGAVVRGGEPLAVLETSKAAEEIDAAGPGVLHRLVPEGAECVPGQAIGRLFASESERQAYLQGSIEDGDGAADPAPDGDGAGELTLTAPAQALAAELGMGPARLRALGKRVVRRSDVEQLAAGTATAHAPTPPAADGPPVRLPPMQRATAALVSESRATIPAAFVAVSVNVDAALEFARRATRQRRAFIGLTELVVAALAKLPGRFPWCFATLTGGDQLRLAGAAHIAVTIDAGSGLYVPVLHDADTQQLVELSRTLMRFRQAAIAGRFHPDELAGANIMVALHADEAVVVAQPIVYPGQVCALSTAGVRREPVPPAGEGPWQVRSVVNLGLSYDHRVLNGRDAIRFLHAVRELLEKPEDLDAT